MGRTICGNGIFSRGAGVDGDHSSAGDAEGRSDCCRNGRWRITNFSAASRRRWRHRKRYQQRHGVPAIPLRVDEAVDARIRKLLPFEFTPAQERVIGELREDLAGVRPMNRLLQGDVGSGKTVVALYAMLAACATRRERRKTKDERRNEEQATGGDFLGHQAALMAPTEILAEQHFYYVVAAAGGEAERVKSDAADGVGEGGGSAGGAGGDCGGECRDCGGDACVDFGGGGV